MESVKARLTETFTTEKSDEKGRTAHRPLSSAPQLEEEWFATMNTAEVVWPSMTLPPLEDEHEQFVALHQWEGYVVDLNEKTFTAKLIDVAEGGTREDGEFDLKQVSNDDLPLLKRGAVFYWSIGYHTDTARRRRTVSELRFRRLPPLNHDEIATARKAAQTILTELGHR
ncbi:MAG TPA: hypothetical protein VNT99_12970 [Methylomirabilota bacterium]|nr:hypothetical protein [Methylomirabilota bacterium]